MKIYGLDCKLWFIGIDYSYENEHWIECLVLIKIVSDVKVELKIWRSDFQIMEVVNYIESMAYVDEHDFIFKLNKDVWFMTIVVIKRTKFNCAHVWERMKLFKY